MGIVRLLIVGLLAGCASAPPQVVHVTWVKVPGLSGIAAHKNLDSCVILTNDGWVRYDEFGAALRKCLGD